jgi:hypothetical protein
VKREGKLLETNSEQASLAGEVEEPSRERGCRA